MKRRFCDRHASRGESVEIELEGFPHVDELEKADEEGSGNITDDWDLCETCFVMFKRFMNGGKVEGEP